MSAELEIVNNAKCVAAAAICTHSQDHACRECHVKAWACLQSAAPLVVAAELERLAEVIDQRAAARQAVGGDDEEPCEDECEETTCHTVASVASYARSRDILRRRAAELRGDRKADQLADREAGGR